MNTNMGHWVTLPFDIDKWLAFTYEIEFADGHKYIGAKKLWVGIKRPPSSYTRKPKKPFKEASWREYNTSSKYVAAKIANGDVIVRRQILQLYKTFGEALYDEARMLFELDVLSSDSVYLNRCIGGTRFTYNSRAPKSKEHNAKVSAALKGKPKSEAHKAKLRVPCTDEKKKKISKTLKGKKYKTDEFYKKQGALFAKLKWINNGVINKRVSLEETKTLIAQGWKLGRTKFGKKK